MKKRFQCRCCGQTAHSKHNQLGGTLSCGCETAKCPICYKCHYHCSCPWGRQNRIDEIIRTAKERQV